MEIIRRDGGRSFAFLRDAGFKGPEATDDGIAFHRGGLHIELAFYAWKNEAEVVTTVSVDNPPCHASLDCLYVACGCGPLQELGGSAPTRLAVAKRVAEHAQGLRSVLPRLLGPDGVELVRRCQGRQLPDE